MTSSALTDSLRETLACFDDPGVPRTTSEVAAHLDLGRRSTYNRLERLVEHDRIETKKVGASARVWWRPPSSTARVAADQDRPTVPGPLVDDVLDDAEIGLFVLNADLEVAWINETAARYFGLERERVLGRDKRDLITDRIASVIEDSTSFADTVLATYEENTDAEQFECHVTAGEDRPARWLEHRSKPIESGEYAGGRIELYEDVTDRKRSDRARRAERTLLERVLAASPTGIGIFDADGEVRRVNQQFTECLGLAETDPDAYVLGDQPLRDEDGNVIPYPERPAARALATDESVVNRHCQVEGHDGETRWLSINAEPLDDGVVTTVADITQLKAQARRLERQREDLESELEAVFDRIDGAFYALDDDLRFTYVNDRAETLLDHPASELLGRTIWQALSVTDDDPLRDRFETALATQTATSFERYSEPLGIWETVRVYPSESGLSVYVTDISEQKEHERDLERQREQLAALNNINDVVRSITDEVIDQSTREEIERVVCERLAETESYLFAWIGDVDVSSQTVNLRTEAGVEGYLDDITISADPNDERSKGPTGRAILEREIQTTQDVDTDSRHDPWRDHIEEYGFRSSAAIPIVYEDTVYGVLSVYADRPNAFEGQERAVISQLGEVVGHAIAATERKRALMSDDVVELQFRIRDIFAAVGADATADGSITIDHMVPIENDEYLVYGTLTEDAIAGMDALTDAIPHWVDITYRTTNRPTSFELRLSDPPVLSAVASLGGAIEQAVIEDGDYRMTVHLAPGADVRRVIDIVQATYPTAELLKHSQTTRADTTAERVRHVLTDELTDRQRAALETAFYAGFFEWPRDASGEDVADSLNIAPATFHQHLRRAQKDVFDSLLSGRQRPD